MIAFTLFINKRKRYKTAIYYFMVVSVVMVYPLIFLVPAEAETPLFLIPCSIIGLLFLRDKKMSSLFWLFCLALYISTVLLKPFIPPAIHVPIETLEFFNPVFICIIFIMFYFVLLYFRNINEAYGLTIEKQKSKILHDGLLLAEKNKEITDSINYAKRIQEAILPPEKTIYDALPGTFILYRPKDIVAGDFYWFEKYDETFFIAAADCTGHGVPGALVSVVCSNALNRSLLESKITDPGKLLDKTREIVLETLSKNNEEVKDGMDISLCKIKKLHEKDSWQIEWAGANNPLIYFSEGNLYEVNADKQPVGKSTHSRPFTTHRLELKKGDSLFLFTDGFADQFGGPKGKKLKYTNLKKLFHENTGTSPYKLNQKLQETFDQWKGELEQIDDVCIIGITL